jgi:hypothetical protein
MSENLRGIIADLQARLDRMQSSLVTPSEGAAPASASVAPFWDVRHMTGVTMTTTVAAGASGAPTVDWDLLFDNQAAANWRRFRIPAGSGVFDQGHLGLAQQRNYRIMWDSDYEQDIICLIAGSSVYTADTPGYVQIKLNGVITEYGSATGPNANGAQYVTLRMMAGRNYLAISSDIAPDTLQFTGLLFEDQSKWVDPSSLPNYRY